MLKRWTITPSSACVIQEQHQDAQGFWWPMGVTYLVSGDKFQLTADEPPVVRDDVVSTGPRQIRIREDE